MTFDEYQSFTEKTALYPEENAWMYLLTGLAGETGELLGKYAKMYRGDPNPETLGDAVEKELGDILWFVAQLAARRGVSLSDVVQKNVDKLSSRKERGTIQGNGDER